jgi:hypothetical protein
MTGHFTSYETRTDHELATSPTDVLAQPSCPRYVPVFNPGKDVDGWRTRSSVKNAGVTSAESTQTMSNAIGSGSPLDKVNEPVETSALDRTRWYLVAKIAKNRH